MKKILFAATVSLFVSALSASAHAWSLFEINGTKMDIDGKDVRVMSVQLNGDNHVYHSHDFDKGVYVIATVWSSSAESLARTTALIRDYLRSRGVNVVDKIEGAAFALKFEVQELNIDGISTTAPGAGSTGQGKSLSDQGADLATKAAIVGAAVKFGNSMSGLAAYGGATTAHYSGTELTLSSRGIVDPTTAKLGENVSEFTRENDGVVAYYKAKHSDPNTTTGDLLTVMTKAWADKYFVKD